MNELEARAALRPTHLFQSSSIFVKKKRILHWETLRSDPKLFQAGAQLQGDIKAKKHTGFFAICSRSLMLVDSTISANCLCKNLLPNSTSQRTWEEASAKALVSICSVNIKGSLISEFLKFWFSKKMCHIIILSSLWLDSAQDSRKLRSKKWKTF